MAPDTIAGVYRQRRQWALDTIRLCLFGTPLLKKGMPWRMRMIYLTVGMAYFCTGFVFPFFYVKAAVDLPDREFRDNRQLSGVLRLALPISWP